MHNEIRSPLKVSEAAKALNISPWTVRRWIETGKLRRLKLGRCVRVPQSEIARLLTEARNKGAL